MNALTFCPSTEKPEEKSAAERVGKISKSNTSSHRRHLLWAGPVNPLLFTRLGWDVPLLTLCIQLTWTFPAKTLTKPMFELYCRHVTINFIISELDITQINSLGEITAMYHNILMLKKTKNYIFKKLNFFQLERTQDSKTGQIIICA